MEALLPLGLLLRAALPGRGNGTNGRGGYDHRRNGGYDRREDRRPAPPARNAPNEDQEAERQRKLAAMQQDATSLDLDREKRLAALAEQEEATHEAEDKARARSSKYGDKGDFINGPTALEKNPVNLSKPANSLPSIFSSSGL